MDMGMVAEGSCTDAVVGLSVEVPCSISWASTESTKGSVDGMFALDAVVGLSVEGPCGISWASTTKGSVGGMFALVTRRFLSGSKLGMSERALWR